MSEEVAPAVLPIANFVKISGPLNGDIICGDQVVAGGTYAGVNTITVTMGGVSKGATLYRNGSWSAILAGVPSGTWDLTATPNAGAGAAAATEKNITVEDPCTLVVAPIVMDADGKIPQNTQVTGTADFTPINGARPTVSVELIPPPSGVPVKTNLFGTNMNIANRSWIGVLPVVPAGKGYCLEVRRNDGTGAMLARVTIGPFEIG